MVAINILGPTLKPFSKAFQTHIYIHLGTPLKPFKCSDIHLGGHIPPPPPLRISSRHSSAQFTCYANSHFLGLPFWALDGLPPTSGDWGTLWHFRSGYTHVGAVQRQHRIYVKPFKVSYEPRCVCVCFVVWGGEGGGDSEAFQK